MRRQSPRSESAEDWFSPPLPRLLAHRGLATEAPENTIAAFAAAVNAGAVYIETDVHASSDGVAMIAHDAFLDRIAGVHRGIEEMSSTELRKLDLGGGHRMPTLREALDGFPGIRFNIDVKAEGAVGALAAAVRDAGATRRVLITSFSWRRRAAALRLLPGVSSSASSSRFIVVLTLAKLGLLHLCPFAVRGFYAVQVPTRVGRVTIATPRVIRALHRMGVEVHIWTVNDPNEMMRLLALGVDGLVTDRIDLAVDLQSRG